jgi:flagellar basal-body rod modification protein FlgD
MAYIPGISQASTTQQTAAAKDASTTKKDAGKTLGQDDFLTLLVAQLQNQDPLNPSDATEFTAQLAQYSQLEQLFNLNKSMDQLAQAQNNSERLSALSLIGKEVVVEGADFTLEGATAEIGYKVDGAASEVTLQIRNASGQTVATIDAKELGKGNHFVTWDGRDRNGNQLPPGDYKMVISAKSSGDSETVAVSPLVRTTVTGVDLSSSEALLVTKAGEFKISAIHGAYNGAQTAAATTAEDEDEAESTEETATTQATPQTAATQAATAAVNATSTATAAANETSISAATDGAGIIAETAPAGTAQ